MRDALTGLLNRRGALAKLAAVDPEKGLTLAICDVDRFKSVNDRYGHVVGDRVLKLVAHSLEESCRPHAVTAQRVEGAIDEALDDQRVKTADHKREAGALAPHAPLVYLLDVAFKHAAAPLWPHVA